MKRKTEAIAMRIIGYLFLSIIAIIIIYPVLYAVLGSFKTNIEVLKGGNFLPEKWNLNNFVEVWEKANFARYTMNSLMLCIGSMVGSIFISTQTAYCLERCDFPGKKILYGIYLSTMFIALGAVTLRPLYLLAVKVNLQNTLWPVIMIHIGSQGTNIFLITKFIKSIPKELDEAAMLDGCSTMGILYKVLLPLLTPILAVVALFQFRLSWNDYITSSVFTMMAPNLRPLTVGVVQLKYGSAAAAEWHLMMTGAAMSIIPILIVYCFCNKYFMSGLTDGAVKG